MLAGGRRDVELAPRPERHAEAQPARVLVDDGVELRALREVGIAGANLGRDAERLLDVGFDAEVREAPSVR